MWDHPLHFPRAAWNAVTIWGDRLWQELIGVLGWQDILLETWTYLLLTALLVLVCLERINLTREVRTRVGAITCVALLAYVVTVYLIFFITYTPIDLDHVRGVQGRYFVIALPIAAILLASSANVDLPNPVIGAAALAGSSVSGIVCVQQLLNAHW